MALWRRERYLKGGVERGGTAEEARPRNPMKFKNGDVSLDDAIKHNGGHLVMANLPGLSALARW